MKVDKEVDDANIESRLGMGEPKGCHGEPTGHQKRRLKAERDLRGLLKFGL